MDQQQLNAVVVGKIDIKPRREVVVPKKQRSSKIQREVQGQMKKDGQARDERRKDNKRFAHLGNQQMLTELHWAKERIRKLEDELKAQLTASALFAADVKRLMQELNLSAGQPGKLCGFARMDVDSDIYVAVNKALGLS